MMCRFLSSAQINQKSIVADPWAASPSLSFCPLHGNSLSSNTNSSLVKCAPDIISSNHVLFARLCLKSPIERSIPYVNGFLSTPYLLFWKSFLFWFHSNMPSFRKHGMPDNVPFFPLFSKPTSDFACIGSLRVFSLSKNSNPPPARYKSWLIVFKRAVRWLHMLASLKSSTGRRHELLFCVGLRSNVVYSQNESLPLGRVERRWCPCRFPRRCWRQVCRRVGGARERAIWNELHRKLHR